MFRGIKKDAHFSGLMVVSRKWKNKWIGQMLVSVMIGLVLLGVLGIRNDLSTAIRAGVMSVFSPENDWTPAIQEVVNLQTIEEGTEGKMVLPVSGIVIRNYGWYTPVNNEKPVWHTGIDIKAQKGEAVKAASGGTVETSGGNSQSGYYLSIRHDRYVTTVYGSLGEIFVQPGQGVKEGEPVGKVGKSYVHFEIRVRGTAVDPLGYLRNNRGKV